jgi:LysR family transcriptional regulator, transcription activator of glutamate synthase operon
MSKTYVILVKCLCGMELNQLRYLVLLGEELHFTRAAERGNVAQPALSRQIRKLEDELGLPLVDRTTRRVSLTPAGLDMVERARRILAELDEARALAKDAKELVTGRVAIGLTTTPGPVDLPRVLGAFHRRYPHIELALREDLSVHLADLLRADRLDLAVVSAIDLQARRQLSLHRLAVEKLVAVLAPDHALAHRKSITMDELRLERFIAFPRGATIRSSTDRAAARAGFAPDIAFECDDVMRTRALVHQGLGVSVLPRSDTESPGPGVVALPFRGDRLTYEVFIAWRAERRLPPASRQLLTTLRDPALA